jgi:hypothetical protein
MKMGNIMVGKGEINELLHILINEPDTLAKIKFNSWEIVAKTVSQLTDIVENEIQNKELPEKWLVLGGKVVFNLRKETNLFKKKCEKRQDEMDKGWKGSIDNCATEFDHFRKSCIPLFISIAGHLADKHPLRVAIESRLENSNYPMML